MKRWVFISWIMIGLLYAQKIVIQTDWHGGPGVSGPVDDWGTQFASSTNINYLYEWGRISLSVNVLPQPIRHNITHDPPHRHSTLMAGDIDGDGDMDVYDNAESPEHITGWFENLGEGIFNSNRNYILNAGGPPYVIDLDLDGDDDIISQNISYHLVWAESHGNGDFTIHTLSTDPVTYSCAGADFDLDGDIDIVTSISEQPPSDLRWWENDGSMNFTPHVITTDYAGSDKQIRIGDFNKDGYPDFVIACYYFNGGYLDVWLNNGKPYIQFTQKRIISPYSTDGCWVEDFDKDGDDDIVTTTRTSNIFLDWWENDGKANFTRHTVANGDTYLNLMQVTVADLNLDGAKDIIVADLSLDRIDWWENKGDNLSFERHLVVDNYPQAHGVYSADIDGDGFKDILGCAWGGNLIDWWDMVSGFDSSGTLESSIIDSKVPYARWGWMEYDAMIYPGTSIKFQARASDDLLNLGDWKDVSSSDVLNIYGRYFQYKAILQTTDPDYTPLLYEVRFIYWGCDLGIESIILPSDTVTALDTIIPEVGIINTMGAESDEGYLIFEVDSAGFIVYKDTVEIPQLNPREYEKIKMKKKWIVGSGDEDFIYKAKAYIECDEDRDSGNDYAEKDIYRASHPGVEEELTKSLEVIGGENNILLKNRTKKIVDVLLYDVTGKLIKKRKLNAGEELCWENLSAGGYFVIIKEKNKTILIKKVVIY